MASSVTEATRGVTRMPTPMPAAAMLNTPAWGLRRWTMLGLIQVRAK